MTEKLSTQVSELVAEVQHLRTQADSDARMIALLKRQNQQQALDIMLLTKQREDEVRSLTQERDEAVAKATEVSGILNTAAHGIVSGLRRMKGDETPEAIPDRAVSAPATALHDVDAAASSLRPTVSRLPVASLR